MARTYKYAIKPWESSSEIFTAGAHELGLSKDFHFVDVLELNGQLPEQTVALILTYTTPENYEKQKTEHKDAREPTTADRDLGVVWLSQTVQNACGPHALFHAIFNSNGRHHLGERSLLRQVQRDLAGAVSYEEQSAVLQKFSELWKKCSEIGEAGLTSPPEDAEEDVEPHFVCFADFGGNLAMFDGDGQTGPQGLDVRLSSKGLIPDQALCAVRRHLEIFADERRRDFSTLLALVDTTI